MNDKVITTSGIFGQVMRLDEQSVQLQIADKVSIKVSKAAIGGYQGQPPVVETPDEPIEKHMSNLRWKVVTILAVFVVFFGLGVYPILASRYHLPAPGWLMEKQLKLGLDLKGGVHLVLRVADRRCAAAGDRPGDGAAARGAEDAQHPGRQHGRARRDPLPGRRRAAGAGRGVPDRGQRGRRPTSIAAAA